MSNVDYFNITNCDVNVYFLFKMSKDFVDTLFMIDLFFKKLTKLPCKLIILKTVY